LTPAAIRGVLAAGDTSSIVVVYSFRGPDARHKAAMGITRRTRAAVVVSESTGKVTVFGKGRIVSTLKPLISRRLV